MGSNLWKNTHPDWSHKVVPKSVSAHGLRGQSLVTQVLGPGVTVRTSKVLERGVIPPLRSTETFDGARERVLPAPSLCFRWEPGTRHRAGEKNNFLLENWWFLDFPRLKHLSKTERNMSTLSGKVRTTLYHSYADISPTIDYSSSLYSSPLGTLAFQIQSSHPAFSNVPWKYLMGCCLCKALIWNNHVFFYYRNTQGWIYPWTMPCPWHDENLAAFTVYLFFNQKSVFSGNLGM